MADEFLHCQNILQRLQKNLDQQSELLKNNRARKRGFYFFKNADLVENFYQILVDVALAHFIKVHAGIAEFSGQFLSYEPPMPRLELII